ncbi:MAG: arabinogalactan endo-1,4-beta-galactosidase [Bacteroidales bacterium]|nr:arabinogalactan endo-1,4-beta-galactosidase [Bacteroidales bacterium]
MSENAKWAWGADDSWYTQMASEGVNPVYNSQGVQCQVPDLLAQYGFNAIRLRLWVDPQYDMAETGGFCNLEDVTTKALRATQLGQRVMIDFQYSDTWADAGNQKVPKAWEAITTPDGMAEKVYQYTLATLNSLKDAGVEVAWVQIGNETSNGMLFPLGQFAIDGVTTSTRVDNYISFFNAGAKAAREVFPSAATVCHLNNGYDLDLYKWFFGEIAKRPVALDMDYIGMSLYPISCMDWDKDSPDWCQTSAWASRSNQCLNAIAALWTQFGKRFLICETGFPNSWTLSAEGGASASRSAMEAKCNDDVRAFLSYFCPALQSTGVVDGIFYWEPECNYFHNYSMGALTLDNRPNAVWDYVREVSDFGHVESIPLDSTDERISLRDGKIYLDGEEAEGRIFDLDGSESEGQEPGVYIVIVDGFGSSKVVVR